MKQLRFYGYSDDNFGEESSNGVDNCASLKPIQCKLVSSEGSMYVIGQYDRANNGCWDIGVCQVDEDIPIPDWEMKFSAKEGYSVILTITVPDDTILTWFDDMKEVSDNA